jgi:predicted phosphoribosyltransferase
LFEYQENPIFSVADAYKKWYDLSDEEFISIFNKFKEEVKP